MTQKPRSGGGGIDRTHPLGQGIRYALLLSEGAGLTTQEERGTVLPAVLSGGAGWGAGKDGIALRMSGSAIVTGKPVPGIAAFTGLTVSTLIYLSSTPGMNYPLVFGTATGSNDGFQVYVSGGPMRSLVNTTSGANNIISSQTLATGQWYHLVFTAGGGKLNQYINGKLDGSSAGSTALSIVSENVCLMGRPDGSYIAGLMEHCIIWDRALSPAEVSELYDHPYAFVKAPSLSRYALKPNTNPPGVPTGLTATNAAAPVLSWTTGALETGANILRSVVSGSGYAQIGTTTGTSYTDSTAVLGQTYYYVVQATNPNGTSASSSQVTAYTPPTAPTLLGGYSGNGQITLVVGGPASGGGSVTYNVYDGTSPGAEGGIAVLTGQTNPGALIVTGLTNGQRYSLFVTAQNAAGESAHSNETSIIPQPQALGRRSGAGLFY